MSAKEEVKKDYGLPNREYFKKFYKGGNPIDKNEFISINIKGDDNCGYRAISLQLYGIEEMQAIIKKKIYEYLKDHILLYKNEYIYYENLIIEIPDYIELIKNDGVWIDDLEISTINKIYNVCLMIFKEINSTHIEYVNTLGELHSNDNIFITLLNVGDNHYNVLYEKDKKTNVISNIIEENKINIIYNKLHKNKIINRLFPKRNSIYQYEDIPK